MYKLPLSEVKKMTPQQKIEYQKQLNAERQRRYKEANVEKVRKENNEAVKKYRQTNARKYAEQNRTNVKRYYNKQKIFSIIEDIIDDAVKQANNRCKIK
jgi:hypothetical protein